MVFIRCREPINSSKMEKNMDIPGLKQMIEQNELSESLEILNERIRLDPNDLQALLLRGRIYYKMQHWGEAINDFSSVLESDPGNAEAKSGIEMARSILGYFTPDMFNP